MIKKIARTSALLLVMGMAGGTLSAVMAIPSAQDRDRDENRDRDRNDDSAYRNNRYYKQGWKDGQHHKRKNKKWKNDADRQAYEAGYARGDRGEPLPGSHHRGNHR
jgi:Ni/Co efflux regulator RcnB